jgi:anaerobic ribonucleoside-triphosphate reductase
MGKYKCCEDVPLAERQYKCYGERCSVILDHSELLGGLCPICNSSEDLVQMCPADNEGCEHSIVSGFAVCPICGAFVCPNCGSHDIEITARITGYLSVLGSWCSAKRQEFMDRVRHTV